MALTVLRDEQINYMLENLTLAEFEEFRSVLSAALHDYSTNTQAVEDGTYHQPQRLATYSPATLATTLYMPSCGPFGMGVKVVTLTAPGTPQQELKGEEIPVIRPTGTVTLLSPSGQPVGFLHASTLTAFRTALTSSCLVAKRRNVRIITAFGAGMQAYWHIRLTLLSRGSTIKEVNIINRSFSDNARDILKKFYVIPSAIKEREGWKDTTFSIVTPGYGEFSRLEKEHIRNSDIIFCCTPATGDLFNANILTSHEGRKKGRLIVAVGSYNPTMRELPVDLLLQATKQHERRHHHFHKHAHEGGVIVVDTLDGVLKEAGEIIQAGIEPSQLVELGELVMLKKMADEDAAADGAGSLDGIKPAEFEKLNLGSGAPSMSSVFGSSESSSIASGTPSSRRDSASSHSRKSASFSLHHRRSSSHGEVDRQKRKDDTLVRWLRDGTVIYKSVGLGLTDLVVGMHLIKMANEKEIGTRIEGF